jgi:hypothetical protein
MKIKRQDSNIAQFNYSSSRKNIYWLGGLASLILTAYCIGTFLIMLWIGPPPEDIKECFTLLNEDKLLGLLRLDILTVFAMPLYYLLFYSIYLTLKDTDIELVTISTILAFIGLTLFLSCTSVFSILNLSEKYALAIDDTEKSQLLAAGEALFTSDIWHGTSAFIGGLLLQTGGLLFSIAMLKSNVFSRITAYTGIFIFGLDLIHILIIFFLPRLSNVLMVIAGTFYLLWFLLVGFRLFQLSRVESYKY